MAISRIHDHRHSTADGHHEKPYRTMVSRTTWNGDENDDTNEDDRGKRGDFIIVYADVFSPYAVMPRKWFRSATDEEMTANDDKYIKKLRREYKRAPTVVLDVNKRPIQVGDELLDEDGTWQVVEALRVTPRNGSVVLSRVKKDPAVTYRAIRSAEPHTETTRAIKPRRSPNTEPTTKEA